MANELALFDLVGPYVLKGDTFGQWHAALSIIYVSDYSVTADDGGIVIRGTEKKFSDTNRLDHIAFAATDPDEIRKRLQAKNVKFREQIVPRTGDTQIFLYDPDGVGVELNFPKP